MALVVWLCFGFLFCFLFGCCCGFFVCICFCQVAFLWLCLGFGLVFGVCLVVVVVVAYLGTAVTNCSGCIWDVA